MTFQIGGKVEVSIEGGSRWAIDAVRDLGVARPAEASGAQLRVKSGDIKVTADLRELEQGVQIGQGVLLDLKYGVRIERIGNTLEFSTDRPAPEWLMWLLHIVGLSAGAAFVHGAAVERRGRAVLFPSWGGVGKTALVSNFVTDHGWNLIGDDLVIIDEDGGCHPFPKPMVLYPYHRTVFPEVFANRRGPVAPIFMNRWLTRAGIVAKPVLRRVPGLLNFARRHNPQSARVAPAEVFGPSAISPGGKVSAICWLERLGALDSPQLLPAGDTLASRIIGSTTNEYDPRCVRLTNVAMGLGILHLNDYWTAWRRIVERALADKPQYVLNLPASMPVADVPGAVRSVLGEAGVWEEAAIDA